jgi:hypothetical protein
MIVSLKKKRLPHERVATPTLRSRSLRRRFPRGGMRPQRMRIAVARRVLSGNVPIAPAAGFSKGRVFPLPGLTHEHHNLLKY